MLGPQALPSACIRSAIFMLIKRRSPHKRSLCRESDSSASHRLRQPPQAAVEDGGKKIIYGRCIPAAQQLRFKVPVKFSQLVG